MISPSVSSATANAFAPGTLHTSIPSSRARAVSIVLVPAPARTTSFREPPASSAAAPTRVLRTTSASNPGTAPESSSPVRRRRELTLVALVAKPFELWRRKCVGEQDFHRVGSYSGECEVVLCPAPAAQKASASISMTVSAPARSGKSSEAVLGSRRRMKTLAVASFAR